MIVAIGTYLPPWKGAGKGRIAGGDEDAVTLAVAAGLEALTGAAPAAVRQVVLVSRDLPLLEGGNSAVLAAALGLDPGVDVVERVGGAPATLDALLGSAPGTLVIGSDASGEAGAAAALIGEQGGALTLAGRVQRSLPLRIRGGDGSVHQDEDPRLQRERGVRASIEAAGLPGKPSVMAGLHKRDAASFCEGDLPELPTVGASAPLFALAALPPSSTTSLVAAAEQAMLSAAHWSPNATAVHRNEPVPREPAKLRMAPGPDIKIAFTAYDRAFESKLRWQAARCSQCATLSLPPRYRCIECGAENDAILVPLPRTGTVYTAATVHVPVPGLTSPYTLAVVQLDGVDVRALVQVTGVGPGQPEIGSPGRLVMRRVAVRSGVPDYGYSFFPKELS